ncbi:hypothetical protein LR48_Vigan04g121700 [Vigna angularis]|uniref:Uncharacterized protein n=1 Tax=Phaseolus angularis TaxID=3914 RepID=A0A0L9UEQ6_PHAAN|nr:hypothetical protein LR48_Vigan04g121700 [Vigna angularis]
MARGDMLTFTPDQDDVPKVDKNLLWQDIQFIRPQKQPMHEPIIVEDDDMAEAEDDPLAKLMTKLPKMNRGPVEVYMDTIIVDQGRSSMYEFVEPQIIQPSGNTIKRKQKYSETWMAESNKDIYFVPYIDGKMKNDLRNMLQGVMGKNRRQLVSVLYPKVCFKSTYAIPEDAIKKMRQEWHYKKLADYRRVFTNGLTAFGKSDLPTVS